MRTNKHKCVILQNTKWITWCIQNNRTWTQHTLVRKSKLHQGAFSNECWTAAWHRHSCLWITFIIKHHHWLKEVTWVLQSLLCYSDRVRKWVKMRRHRLKPTALVGVTKWLNCCTLWHMIITFFRCHWVTYYWAVLEKNTLVIGIITGCCSVTWYSTQWGGYMEQHHNYKRQTHI